MLDAVITKTAKGAYMAQGHDGKGNKLTTLMGEEKAMAAIKAGVAKQGWYKSHYTTTKLIRRISGSSVPF